MNKDDLTAALARAQAASRAAGAWMKARAANFAGSGMRALSRLAPNSSPEASEVLAAPHVPGELFAMGKADLDTVVERRSEIAREVAAIEAMRVEMEAEDQELLVAERVLRRLAEASGRGRAGLSVAAASNEG